MKHTEDLIVEIQYLNQINYNIDLLSNHLTNIAEAITLARLNIISKHILNSNELKTISNHIHNQSFNVNSEEQLYEILNMQAYYNHTNIIFNIQIPTLSTYKYDMFHIIPMPINNTKTIVTKPYILYNEHNIQYLTKACPKIENIFLCQESTLQEKTQESTCVGRLINKEAAQCPLEDVGKVETIIQPEPNYILFINVPKTLIKSTRRNKPINIHGTILIHYQNCKVEVNGIIYEDTVETFTDKIYILPSPTIPVRANTTKNVITLQKLEDHRVTQDDKIDKLELSSTIHLAYSHLTIATSIILIAILIVLLRKRAVHYIINKESVAPATPTSLWPSLYSRGGGVTSAPTTTQATSAPVHT